MAVVVCTYGTTVGSAEEAHWREKNPYGYRVQKVFSPRRELVSLHDAAARGEVEQIRKILNHDTRLINQRNKNGMTPLHVSFCLILL